MGIVAVFSAAKFTFTLQDLSNRNTAGAVQLANAQNALWQLRYGVSQFIAVPDPQARAKIVSESDQWYRTIDENLAKFASFERSVEERQALEAFRESYKKYVEARPHWLELYGQRKTEEAAEWRAKTILPFGKATVESLSKLIDLQQKASAESEREAIARINLMRNVVVIPVVLAALVLGSSAVVVLIRSITHPLNRAVTVAQTVAAGDLTSKIDAGSSDEIGQLLQALKDMSESLVRIVAEVRGGTDLIATASGEIASGSQDLSSRTEQQASSLEAHGRCAPGARRLGGSMVCGVVCKHRCGADADRAGTGAPGGVF